MNRVLKHARFQLLAVGMAVQFGLVGGHALATGGAAGVRSGDAARLSVERLLFHADGHPVTPAPPDWPEAVRQGVAGDQVRMFLSAVIDHGEGQHWCVARSGRPPHEVAAELIAALRAHTSAHDGAAHTVATILARRFPCAAR